MRELSEKQIKSCVRGTNTKIDERWSISIPVLDYSCPSLVEFDVDDDMPFIELVSVKGLSKYVYSHYCLHEDLDHERYILEIVGSSHVIPSRGQLMIEILTCLSEGKEGIKKRLRNKLKGYSKIRLEKISKIYRMMREKKIEHTKSNIKAYKAYRRYLNINRLINGLDYLDLIIR